jgi:hypothetical protein
MEELDKILSQDETARAEEETQKKALEAKAEEEKKQDDPVQKKQEQLKNLETAISQANEELRKLRESKKEVKEEEIPKIDDNDPSSKAWTKRINETVAPVKTELDQEKSEIFNFSIKKFLTDKLALAGDGEKLKEFIGVYEKIKSNSGRTQEGVTLDLEKAFAATYAEELISQARESEVWKAEGNAMFSEPAISRGSTSYFQEKPDYNSALKGITEDDKQHIFRMGYKSVEEWAKDKEKYK